MGALAFKQVIHQGDVGLDSAAVKRALQHAGFGEGLKFGSKRGPKFGKTARRRLMEFQRKHGVRADGIYGPATHLLLRPYFTAYARLLYRRAKVRSHSLQQPPLPKHIFFPLSHYRQASNYYGVQPWIAPQIQYLCKRFNLRVSAGWASSGHAGYSDHYWGGAVDLVGSMENMVAANLFCDHLRELGVLRWVGGPAHDADGVEHGHGDHVHASWFRYKATSIFNTLT